MTKISKLLTVTAMAAAAVFALSEPGMAQVHRHGGGGTPSIAATTSTAT